MQFQFEVKPLKNLNDEELTRVKALTLNLVDDPNMDPDGESGMQFLLRRRQDFKVLAVLASDGRDIRAWASIRLLAYRKPPTAEIYVYVQREYRRRGLGTRLLRYARALMKKLFPISPGMDVEVCPWDKRARRFFHNTVKVGRFAKPIVQNADLVRCSKVAYEVQMLIAGGG